MLELRNIVKDYAVGDSVVTALKGVNLAFRDSEFVSVLGPSGCGKTTLLNIIGGLDRYTSGDLIINGRSTKEFRDGDWDAYRNHSIGFVFQSYNLIPHQSVLSNVELALTLSGVSKVERRRRAAEALEKVGLADQMKKRPNQLSGGQMQRVAIARALVNDPDILLADEPTGALDSDTSVQVMELLKEISKDKLIIMVTHNGELAHRYSTRIVKLLDGLIVDDSDPYTVPTAPQPRQEPQKKTFMSFFTALSLSFNNLLTKKGRTFMTAFAGSIGIIGIALILAMSNGVQRYIDDVQEDTLSSYPITIEAEQNDLGAMLSAFSKGSSSEPNHELDAVYCNSAMYEMFNAVFATETTVNNLTSFKTYVDKQMSEPFKDGLGNYVSDVQYQYDVTLNNYVKGVDGSYHRCDLDDAFGGAGGESDETGFAGMMSGRFNTYQMWQELMPGQNGQPVSDVITQQYDLLYGKWPSAANEVVLIVDPNNEITDLSFYALGLIKREDVTRIFTAAMNGEHIESLSPTVSYEDICNISFKLLLNTDYYSDKDDDGVWEYIGDDEAIMDMAVKNGFDLNIVGILRPNTDSATGLSGSFGYTSALTRYIIETTNKSDVVRAQTAPENSNLDVLTGLPFVITEELDPSDASKAEQFKQYIATLNDAEKATKLTDILALPPEGYVDEKVAEYMEQYQTRQDMEELVSSTYGMDAETASSYLSSYSDEELRDLIQEQLGKVILQNFTNSATQQVDTLKNTPSEQELAGLMARITSQLTTAEARRGYVLADWSESTSMSQSAIMAYLMGLSDEELSAAVNAVAAVDAADMYASMAGADEAAGNAKVAAVLDAHIASSDEATLAKYYDLFMPSTVSGSTYSDNLKTLGVLDLASPSAINLYASSFENKDAISRIISDYNTTVAEEDKITYTDYVALLMSGITTIIDAISYGLIIFVSVSLVVSSIMIGIITYVSVLERTKEIGILRAVGASKRDISRVFNAETLIVGFTSGALGILVSLLLCIPINLIVHSLTGISTINAYLPWLACVILVLISMALTLLAGLIPSGVAAKKDPVVALRTE